MLRITSFPSYREHIVGTIRGVDGLDIIRLMRGVTNGGWNPEDPGNGNVHPYTLVLGTQTLHATGYAMGMKFDGVVGTGDPDVDAAVMVYFGDGASSEGDVSEAFVFAASYQTPQVFFLQNNHWAISVPVSTQSRTRCICARADSASPVCRWTATMCSRATPSQPSISTTRATGTGRASSKHSPTAWAPTRPATTRPSIAATRRFNIGRTAIRSRATARTSPRAESMRASSQKPTRRRPIPQPTFRARTLALPPASRSLIFDNVYSEAHPLMDEQKAWLERYEASFEASAVTDAAEASA